MKYYFGLWKKHKFKVIVFMSIAFILFASFFNKRGKGTWSSHYYYDHVPFIRNFSNIPLPNNVSFQPHEKQSSKGEQECRRVLEKLFGVPFPNMRPSFLHNDVTNKKLEIDCCNLELGLGVEYNGQQHYNFTKQYHKTDETFQLQKYRDKIKRDLCKQHNFTLIIVPYTIPIHSIENYLIEELRKHNFIE